MKMAISNPSNEYEYKCLNQQKDANLELMSPECTKLLKMLPISAARPWYGY